MTVDDAAKLVSSICNVEGTWKELIRDKPPTPQQLDHARKVGYHQIDKALGVLADHHRIPWNPGRVG